MLVKVRLCSLEFDAVAMFLFGSSSVQLYGLFVSSGHMAALVGRKVQLRETGLLPARIQAYAGAIGTIDQMRVAGRSLVYDVCLHESFYALRCQCACSTADLFSAGVSCLSKAMSHSLIQALFIDGARCTSGPKVACAAANSVV